MPQMYPNDSAGLQKLADDLTASGFVPTQPASKMDRDKIERMAQAMAGGTFDWSRIKPWEKIIVGPGGEIMNGHHRVIAAMLAGIPIPTGEVVYFLGQNLRPIYNWIDVLPK